MYSGAADFAQRNNWITSKPYLCFAACLQLAVEETVGLTIDQIVIANRLGVTLPDTSELSELQAAGVTNIRFDSHRELCGIAPILSEINSLLREWKARLQCTFASIARFQDWEFEERLSMATESHLFPIIGFDRRFLLDQIANEPEGHCVVCYGVHGKHGRAS